MATPTTVTSSTTFDSVLNGVHTKVFKDANGNMIREQDVNMTFNTTDKTTTTFDNGILDISIIPFMRSIEIDFAAFGVRPQRQLWFFFDDVDVTNYIIKADEIEFTANANNAIFNDGVSNNDTIRSGSNTAIVRASLQKFLDSDTGSSVVARKRRMLVTNVTGYFANTAVATGSITGNSATVSLHNMRGWRRIGRRGGTGFPSISSNTIVLPTSTAKVANNFWGTDGANNLLIIVGDRANNNLRRTARANIQAFNNVTRTMTLSKTFSQMFPGESTVIRANSISLSISNTRAETANSDHKASREGVYAGTFVVPAAMFRTGERVFRILDNPQNSVENATTRAEYKFSSSGLNTTRNDIVLNQTTTTESVVTFHTRQPTTHSPGEWNFWDPVAQTFFVNAKDYPNGVFIPQVKLWFKSKDDIVPVSVELRPTVNGYPHSNKVIPGGTSKIPAEQIVVYNDTPYANAALGTKAGTMFKFKNPVYVPPGEYAVVVRSDSPNYEVWLSELGAKIIGSTRIVSEQPYAGSFFKSQNASTWEPSYQEDLMVTVYACYFDTSGIVNMYNLGPEANVPADMTFSHAEDHVIPNTSISYTQTFDSGSNYETYVPDVNYIPTSRLTIGTDDGQYRLRAVMRTGDRYISPIIYDQRCNFLAIENYINNANISNADITITAEGSGFSQNSNTLMTISGGNATLNATAYVIGNTAGSGTSSNGADSIIVTDGGAGYINTATLTVQIGSNTQTFKVASELDASGGNMIAKYISKRVNLAEGFDAGDIRVFLTAHKPSGTNIHVYYKVRNSLDPVPFEKRPYVLMRQQTSTTTFSLNETDPKEFEYRPYSANSIPYSSDTTTYSTFNQFAIKIALQSDNTVKYPFVFDMRAIALPGESS